MDVNLSGKTALVCGASKGIGRAIALELAELNANVIVLARNEEKLQSLLSELKGTGKHTAIALDISNLSLLKEKLTSYLTNNGTIHILINNTGGPKAGSLLEAKEEDFASAFHNHVIVNSTLANLLIPNMKKEKFGRIINIISTSVKVPIPNLGVSNTIRAAVANWSKTLSAEVASHGITVNNVLPGYTATERLTELMENAATKNNKEIQEIEKQWINSVPAGRFGEPKEIAQAVAFLASNSASYITGINLPIDGGRTVCL